jgi:hypothetical protein
MTDQGAPVPRHLASAREHAAGLRASAAWVQDLAAAHLLKSEAPIKDQPVTPPTPETVS